MSSKPKPTGRYPVGTRTFTVYNTRKEELDLKGDSMRHIPARIYYPAPVDLDTGYVKAESLSRSEAQGIRKVFMIPVNYDKISSDGSNEAECYIDPPFAEGEKFPLIVFNHGYFSYIEGNSYLLIELASHGYIVLSVGHPYEAVSTDFDDGTYILADKSLSRKMYHPFLGGLLAASKLVKMKGTLEEQAAAFDVFQNKYCTFIKHRVDEWIKDTAFAVDHVRKTMADKIDFTNGIGCAGHSNGGAVAYSLCLNDDDYTCGINIDGGLFGDYKDKTMHKPFMQLSCKDNENVVTRGYLRHTAPAYKVLVRDMKHMGFADIKYAMKPGATVGKLDPDLAHRYTCKSYLEFFDCYLKKAKDKPDLASDDVITVTEFAPDTEMKG
ncbi:MAG: hypothetical protein J6X33_06515 [Clostridiales bacterium]|nr:hypothetical protein [Clostridiales bacterium]